MFRVGQRVCRITWTDGVPGMRFGTVTKTTARTYHVDNTKGDSWWFATAKEAFGHEYRDLFSDWGIAILKPPLSKNWTVYDTIRCVCRLRRMERRLIRKVKAKPQWKT